MVVVNMSFKEILFSTWKSPKVSAEESQFEEIKKEKKQKLNQMESRLESLEILISNDKLEDANILMKYLIYDLVNFYQSLSGNKTIPFEGDLSLFSIPESKTKAFQFLSQVSKEGTTDESKLNDLFESCLITYDFLLGESKKQFRTKWFTTLDQFKAIRKIRIILITSILSFSVFGVLYYQYKFPVMKDQNIKLYSFADREHPQTSESQMVSMPVSKQKIGEWNEYVFALPDSMAKFGGLRIDPLEQRGIHFVLDEFQVLDGKGKPLYSKKIVVSQNLLPEDYQDFLKISDIKTAGKQQPGELVEMVTTGRDPQILLVFPPVDGAKTIKIKMKYIEAHKLKKK
ncbi:hypothetical protein EHQ79_01955 [Leptospira jelokensis]|nr:hypothetical protein EHQ79_01955 [Leptospira jelokensis]